MNYGTLDHYKVELVHRLTLAYLQRRRPRLGQGMTGRSGVTEKSCGEVEWTIQSNKTCLKRHGPSKERSHQTTRSSTCKHAETHEGPTRARRNMPRRTSAVPISKTEAGASWVTKELIAEELAGYLSPGPEADKNCETEVLPSANTWAYALTIRAPVLP